MDYSIIYDKDDRLCTEPLTRKNMSQLSNKFNIKSCWLETNYYKIPPFRKEKVREGAKKVSTHYMDKILKDG